MSEQVGNSLYNKHKQVLEDAIVALAKRTYYTPYPEHPKAYDEDANEKGKEHFGKKLNENSKRLN